MAGRSWANWAPAAVWAGFIFLLSSRSIVVQPSSVAFLPFVDKFEHFAEYAALALLILWGFRRGPRILRPISPDFQAHLAFFAATLYGVTDEFHQAFVPFRQADGLDLLVDALGAFTAAFAFSMFLSPAPPRLTPPDRELRVKGGLMRYTWMGGEGAPIVYLHGWHGSKRYFAAAARLLPFNQHLAPDLLGFGASEAPARFSYAPLAHALSARAVARSVGIHSAIVVGHSMGGAAAVALALEDPAFVKGLVLVEPAIRLPVPYPFLLVREDLKTIGYGSFRHFLGFKERVLVHLLVEDEAKFPRGLMEDALSVPLHASAKSLGKLLRSDLGRRLGHLRCPVLLVFGDERHPVRAKYARLLADEIDGSVLVHLPNTSHCPMVEAPEAFYATVSAFMDGPRFPNGARGRKP